jgi:AraC-like DNA-binding protein
MGMPIAREIHFKHGDPGYRDEYDRIFQAPIFFNADKNAILFDNAVLTFRNPLASRHAARVLGDKAESLLRLLERSTTTRGEVERLLAPELSARRAGMGSIAQTMGVSRKTLFRRLKAEGVTFEHVQDELRREIALDHLTLRNASVNETAYLVGFSDPAAFSRAFKRWTGMSPRTARQVLSRADGTFERAAGMRPTSLSREGRLDA